MKLSLAAWRGETRGVERTGYETQLTGCEAASTHECVDFEEEGHVIVDQRLVEEGVPARGEAC